MKECIFCKIINKEIPAKILYEDNFSLCIMDINPISDGHCIVIPKIHCDNLCEANEEILKQMLIIVNKIAKKINNSKLNNNGINYLINEGENAGQEIMHLHIHIIPKFNKDEGFILKNKINNKKTIDDCYELIKSSIVI